MEVFKFHPGADPTVLEQGEVINNATSIMWVERYREPGEFEIIAKLSTGLSDFLPIGTFISHADTMEVMIVENQEIDEDAPSDPDIKITGRSLETYLENRITGTNQARTSSTYTEYLLAAGNTWTQAVKLINDHIAATSNAGDQLGNVLATTVVTGTGTSEARSLKRGPVYNDLLEILAVDDLGIRNIRRNTFGGNNAQTIMEVYKGVDKSAKVIFSWKAGDLDGADYFWSGRVLKNSAMVVGRYINTIVDLGPTKYARKMMVVDGSDIDGNLTAPPTGSALTSVLAKMTTRGKQVLAKQTLITITRADISDLAMYRYRRDYNIGDIISLNGNFGQIAKMRVIEYVEIEDENGESGHPTLSVPDVTALRSGLFKILGE